MDLRIFFQDLPDDENSYQLAQLASLIQDECEVAVLLEKEQPREGVRDGGLVTAIAIVSLSVAAYQALISTLQYWDSRQTRYTVSITSGNATMLLENVSKNQAEEVFKENRNSPSTNGYIGIQISHRR